VSLPVSGLPADQVLDSLRSLRSGDLPTHGGRTLAYVYDSGLSGLDELAAEAHALASSANALDPTAFPSLLRMENDIVAAAAALLGGGESTVGTVTSGGTESCMLAVHAARAARPDLTRPRIVLPSTAHAAFHKAAHYFDVETVVVPVTSSFTADPTAMAAAIDDRTVLVVASAPSYAHGVIDPVVPIAAAARERGVRCHVDACIGGWVLPYFRALGVRLEPFDLSVPGVTSLSVDLHKYAYCPKGTSVLLHADADLRRSQFFASAAWPGYTMLNSTLQSTRSGGPLAAAWAVLNHIGDNGYRALATRVLSAVRAIREGITSIAGLEIQGNPQSTLLSVAASADDFDVFTVADEMTERGWYLQPQFGFESSPPNLHLTVTAANHGSEDRLVADLAASVAAARERGPVSVAPELRSAIADLDPAALTPEMFEGLLLAAGLTEVAAPKRMAEVNSMLAAAPPPLRERLLVEFLSVMYTP
jgi:sphinganine-1-phosphate aldolase